MNKIPLDNKDFRILTIVANSEKLISSWEICKKLFPREKNAQKHLSSVIWRLHKLTNAHALTKHPHPIRRKKVVYGFSNAPFSSDGTVFIPSKLGGVIVSCRFAGNGHPCKLDSRKCKLSEVIGKEGQQVIQAFYLKESGGNG